MALAKSDLGKILQERSGRDRDRPQNVWQRSHVYFSKYSPKCKRSFFQNFFFPCTYYASDFFSTSDYAAAYATSEMSRTTSIGQPVPLKSRNFGENLKVDCMKLFSPIGFKICRKLCANVLCIAVENGENLSCGICVSQFLIFFFPIIFENCPLRSCWSYNIYILQERWPPWVLRLVKFW